MKRNRQTARKSGWGRQTVRKGGTDRQTDRQIAGGLKWIEIPYAEASPKPTHHMDVKVLMDCERWTPSLVVFVPDGINTTSHEEGSCSHTDLQAGAWWVVDLGEECRIDRVDITNRGDCCGLLTMEWKLFNVNQQLQNSHTIWAPNKYFVLVNWFCLSWRGSSTNHFEMKVSFLSGGRLGNFDIRAGNSFDQSSFDPGSLELCYHEVNPVGDGEAKSFTCVGDPLGRYVSISFPATKTEYLTLCEVEIFGVPGKTSIHYVPWLSTIFGTDSFALPCHFNGHFNGHFVLELSAFSEDTVNVVQR